MRLSGPSGVAGHSTITTLKFRSRGVVVILFFLFLAVQHLFIWKITHGHVSVQAAITLHLLTTFGIVVAIWLGKYFWSLIRSRREMFKVREAVEAALADERARIARELHDTINHGLALITLMARQSRVAAAQRIDELSFIDKTAFDTMRALSHLLNQLDRHDDHPACPSERVGWRSLDNAVSDVTDQLRNLGVPVKLVSSGHEVEVPEPLAGTVQRVIAEGLLNIVKHMPGATAMVSINVHNEITLLVRGNGSCPLSSRRAEPILPSNRRGLKGLADQVRVYGGHLCFSSGPEFSLIEASIPLALNRNLVAEEEHEYASK